MAGWLVLVHTPSPTEYAIAVKQLAQLRMAPGKRTYLLWFAPRGRCMVAVLGAGAGAGMTVLAEYVHPRAEERAVPVIRALLQHVPRAHVSAVGYAGHGNGYLLGKWATARVGFLTIVEFGRHVLDRFRPRLVCFDACWEGSLTCLVDIPRYVEYVVSAPGLHPMASVTCTPAFADPPARAVASAALLQYARRLTRQFHTHTPKNVNSFRCMVVFKMRHMPELVRLVAAHWPELQLDEHSRIDRREHNLHDLRRAAQNLPQLRAALTAVVGSSTSACSRVAGPSVEKGVPRKFRADFLRTTWYRLIHNKL